jgi:hypothetical protein
LYIKMFTWYNPKGFVVERKNVWDAAWRNPFMD